MSLPKSGDQVGGLRDIPHRHALPSQNANQWLPKVRGRAGLLREIPMHRPGPSLRALKKPLRGWAGWEDGYRSSVAHKARKSTAEQREFYIETKSTPRLKAGRELL